MKNILRVLFPEKRSLLNFLLVALCSQFIYVVLALKGVAFQQMTDMWEVSATELGALLSINAFVGTFSYFFLAWMHDRFSVRFMLSTGIGAVGVMTFFIVFSHQYWLLFALFAVLGLMTEGYFWPAVLNAVRQSTDHSAQGKAFGVMEFLRGSIEFAQNAFALWLFVKLGESVGGLRGAMAVNAVIMIILAVIVWKVYPEKVFLHAKKAGGKTKESFIGLLTVLRLPEVWLVGITGASVYAAYVAVPYFQIFLKDHYAMPVTLASVFALFNTSLTRLLVAPIAGTTSDHVFKGSTNAMRVALLVMIGVLVIISIMPRGATFIFPAMIMLILSTVMVYFLRPLYFVPVGEMNMPERVSGSAMAIGSLLVYSPAAWGYVLYGYITDVYKDNGAYERIFAIMIGWATLGIISASLLKYRMKHKKEKFQARINAIDTQLEKLHIETVESA